MTLSQKEIRDRATEFAHDWIDVTREKAEAQTFWNEFFNIFGLTRRRVASFEEPVRKLGDQRGSIDLFWKGTLLVEHKSKGQDLDSAYQQALDYFPGIAEQDLPKYVLVSDFHKFRLYDLDEDTEADFKLKDLPQKIHLFGFISGYKKQEYREEDPVNIKVAEKMGELHDALLDSGYSGHALEVFLVRLMYCLFADDTGIFPRDHFHFFLENRTAANGSDIGSVIATIFQTLNTADSKRQTTMDEELRQFQYVNGALFSEVLAIPSFNAKMRTLLLDCCSFDWGKVSPAVFGSMFQAVMDPAQRRNLGAHYTSEKNILKVIRDLFLNALWREYKSIKHDARKLRQFHNKLTRLRFFDPACGCGNFLVIAYREVRRLEIEVLKQLRHLSGETGFQLTLNVSEYTSRLDVDMLYGIEVEEFPARIAEVALWLTDHQLNMQMSAEFGHTFARLPLSKAAHITHGNALRLDWTQLISKADVLSGKIILFIFGNPPFVAKHLRTPEQNADMALACHALDNYGTLDYVCAWYVKAAEYMQDFTVEAAFVSTNSITQGEQVGALWPYLLSQGVKIHFAHRTFRWANEARGKAHVFCVVIGFAMFNTNTKHLYDYESPDAEPMMVLAQNINPYLIDADDVVISTRTKPICDMPEMLYGSKPVDDGQLFFTEEEKIEFLRKEPHAKKYMRVVISAHEFINGESRYCLWLEDVSPAELRDMPEVMKRVDNVKRFRADSKKLATVKLAATPYLFAEIRQPKSEYVLVPRHSSENRRYIPMAFFTKDYIVSDSCTALPQASLYHFGVLTSVMHMAWMRQVCGRIKSDYRYSNSLVYNNFPWPEKPTAAQQRKVEAAAQHVLDVRAKYPDSTLADLYDPDAMPKALLDAHKTLDAAVDACYRTKVFRSELERLEFLFALYRKYSEPMTQAIEQVGRKKSRKEK
jgi:hypothetical protein